MVNDKTYQEKHRPQFHFTARKLGPFQGDLGGNFYAAQTWNNTGSRVVQISWMRGGDYPGVPFNQQMSFPCDLSLRQTQNGIRLCRSPIPEIDSLYLETRLIFLEGKPC